MMIPTGWKKRRDGLVVPRPTRNRRLLEVAGRLVLMAALLAPTVATTVSSVSRAATDVVTLLRSAGAEVPTLTSNSRQVRPCYPNRPY